MGALIKNDSSVRQRSQLQLSAQQRHVKWKIGPCSESHSSATFQPLKATVPSSFKTVIKQDSDVRIT